MKIPSRTEKKWSVISKLARQLLSDEDVHLSAGTISNYKRIRNKMVDAKDKDIPEAEIKEMEGAIDAITPELLKAADNRARWEKQLEEASKE